MNAEMLGELVLSHTEGLTETSDFDRRIGHVRYSALRTFDRQGETHCVPVQNARMTEAPNPDAAERLKRARLNRGFKNPREATSFFGWSYDTYVQHENGIRGIQRAVEKYAKAFRVSKAWLLTGEGAESPGTTIPIVGYVGAGAQILPIDGMEGDQVLDEVDLDFPLPAGTVAAIVRGDSMLPVFEDGDLIGYHRDAVDPSTVLNRTCIVKVTDGPTYVKTLKRGSEAGLFTLVSFNSTDIEDVSVEWVAPFQFRVSRFQWKTRD